MSKRQAEFERIPCPHCGSNSHEVFIAGTELETYRFYRRLEGFEALNYVLCLDCRLVFANPRLRYTDTTLDELFPTHVRDQRRQYPPDDDRSRERPRERVTNVASLLGERRGRFLEIGCGSGHALAIAESLGFQVTGTEIYRGFVDFCRDRGLDVRPGSVDSLGFEDNVFDVVYLEDVLEHLKNPFTYLEDAARVLKPGGILFIHTWTIRDPTDVLSAFGKDWRSNYNLDLTAHTTLFPRDLLEGFVKSRGFQICRADPLRRYGEPPAHGPDRRVQVFDYYLRKAT